MFELKRGDGGEREGTQILSYKERGIYKIKKMKKGVSLEKERKWGRE